jgi:UDP-N-acetylmuramate dehydrogenase
VKVPGDPLGTLNAFKGIMLIDEPMAPHNSWRAGGCADRFYLPLDLDDLCCFLSQLPDDEPLFWLGLGSNLLVRDGGIRGTVLCTLNRLKGISLMPHQRIRVECGVPCAHVAKFSAEKGLVGAEFLAGIPGTMGGALAMNAGAFGGETWRKVMKVTTIDRKGVIRTRGPDDFVVGYRSVEGPPGEWFIAAELQLEEGDVEAARAQIKTLLAKRAATQPTNLPSCGSVFRNPTGDHAARLIEASGLKGFRIGNAQVSEKHSNFIVNLGGARSLDIEALILHVMEEVRRHQGIALKPEVRIVGSELRGRDEQES